jgi:hypothetical protein
MASIVFFQDFTEQLSKGIHQFGTHTYRIALTNTAPVATQVSLSTGSDHPPPAAANGYTAGGTTTTVTVSETSGTTTIQGTQVVFTATAGGIGPFRYAILYNDTASSPADALVSYWDYGSSVTLADTETFTVKFNNASPGTILTVATS